MPVELIITFGFILWMEFSLLEIIYLLVDTSGSGLVIQDSCKQNQQHNCAELFTEVC